MKVLIDIPDVLQNYHQRWALTQGGIVLDGLTNGEVMQKAFPSLKSEVGAKNLEVYLYSDAECVDVCDFAWWNRKWGE